MEDIWHYTVGSDSADHFPTILKSCTTSRHLEASCGRAYLCYKVARASAV